MESTHEALDNSLIEAVISLNEPQLNVHTVYGWMVMEYPDYVTKMGEEKRARQIMSYSLRRLSKKGLLKNVGKAHGSIVYEYTKYDRTPERGEDKPCILPKPKKYSSDGETTTFVVSEPEKDIKMEIIEKLMEQNERLIDAIVSMIK